MSTASLLATAQRLIDKHGRTVTLIEFDNSIANPAFPFEGPVSPRGVPARSTAYRACFVEPDSLQRLGITTKVDELIQRSDRICLIAGPDSLAGYNEVVDQAQNYRITGIETLQPGETVFLHFVGTAR